jgi:predicted RecA/RadA family phage recombinase
MAVNEAYQPQPRTLDVNVTITTVLPGDPVVVGGFIGVAQTASDGGAAVGKVPTPIAGETVQNRGPYQAAGHCTIMCSGIHKMTLVAAAAVVYGAPIYYQASDRSLRDTAAGNTLWGYLYDSSVTAAGTVRAFVAVACPIA